MKKPKDQIDMTIDVYYEQFAEPDDQPTVTVHFLDDVYQINPKYPHIAKQELKRMKAAYKWLGQAIKYVGEL